MVELQGAQLTAENDNCDADNVSVCIAVRIPASRPFRGVPFFFFAA